jgi:hypothetical protein
MPFLYLLDICRQPSRALDTLLETFNTIALPNKEGKLERHKEIKGKMVRTWLLGQWIWHFLSVLHGLAWHDTLFVPFMIFHVWVGAVLHQNGVTQYPFACVCSFSRLDFFLHQVGVVLRYWWGLLCPGFPVIEIYSVYDGLVSFSY